MMISLKSKLNKGLLVSICLLFLSCATKQEQVPRRFSGDHTTAQIRGMWHICFQTRMKSIHNMFPAMHMQHCDCLVDNSRENFSSQDYDKMDKDNLTDFFRVASILCDGSTVVPNESIEL